MSNDEIFVLVFIFIMFAGIFFILYTVVPKELRDELFKKDTDEVKELKKTTLYDFELYLENGELFLKDEEVDIIHWDNNIYIIRDKNDKHIQTIHKGSNMLLVKKKSMNQLN